MNFLKSAFRFRLRTLLGLVLLACCLFGWLTNAKIQHAREMASIQKFQLADSDNFERGYEMTRKGLNARAGMDLLGASK